MLLCADGAIVTMCEQPALEYNLKFLRLLSVEIYACSRKGICITYSEITQKHIISDLMGFLVIRVQNATYSKYFDVF